VPRFFRCDFGDWRTRGDVSHHLLEMLLDLRKRCREGQALQHDSAGPFVTELGEVYPKTIPSWRNRGSNSFSMSRIR
jgi:hypothetical protein